MKNFSKVKRGQVWFTQTSELTLSVLIISDDARNVLEDTYSAIILTPEYINYLSQEYDGIGFDGNMSSGWIEVNDKALTNYIYTFDDSMVDMIVKSVITSFVSNMKIIGYSDFFNFDSVSTAPKKEETSNITVLPVPSESEYDSVPVEKLTSATLIASVSNKNSVVETRTGKVIKDKKDNKNEYHMLINGINKERKEGVTIEGKYSNCSLPQFTKAPVTVKARGKSSEKASLDKDIRKIIKSYLKGKITISTASSLLRVDTQTFNEFLNEAVTLNPYHYGFNENEDGKREYFLKGDDNDPEKDIRWKGLSSYTDEELLEIYVDCTSTLAMNDAAKKYGLLPSTLKSYLVNIKTHLEL